jgi:hypothetical protein
MVLVLPQVRCPLGQKKDDPIDVSNAPVCYWTQQNQIIRFLQFRVGAPDSLFNSCANNMLLRSRLSGMQGEWSKCLTCCAGTCAARTSEATGVEVLYSSCCYINMKTFDKLVPTNRIVLHAHFLETFLYINWMHVEAGIY